MGRNVTDFIEGKRPNLMNIHSAVLEGNISKEEGMDLSPLYQPDKVMRKGKNKSGSLGTRTQAQQIVNTIKHHPKYKKKSEDDNG